MTSDASLPPHAPLLKRMRVRRQEASTAGRNPRRHAWGGMALAVVLILLSLLGPGFAAVAGRLAYLGSMGALIACFGFLMGRGNRAYIASGVGVALLYALSNLGLLFGVSDIYFLVLLSSLILYLIAGINLLFVVESLLYDIHRAAHGHTAATLLIPIGVLLILASLLVPLGDLGYSLGTVKAVLPLVAFLLLLAAGLALRYRHRFHAIHQEIHLLITGLIVGAAIADAISFLPRTSGLLPGLLGYFILLATWFLVGFRMLHKAQMVLPRTEGRAWAMLLTAALLAVVGHSQERFAHAGQAGVESLTTVRIIYLGVGVWIGLFYFGVRGCIRLFRLLKVSGAVRDAKGRGAYVAHIVEEGLELPHHAMDRIRERVGRSKRRSKMR